jgi:hypothetical protein
MTDRKLTSVLLLFLCGSYLAAQPTYRLEVRPFVKPQASLTLEGSKVKRSMVKDDPGFRLQYHIKKDGKTLSTVEARSQPALDLPQKDAGTYSVVLELFYPTYKPGNAQKGQFKAISNVLTYRLTPGPKPGAPAKIQLVEPPAPVAALVLRCGKGNGKTQEEKSAKGFSYKLLQGANFDSWPKTAAATHCWMDAKEVRFELTVPANTGGVLRLHFIDGDNKQRKQLVLVQGKAQGEIAGFAGMGKRLEVSVSAAELPSGKIEVRVQNLGPAGGAVISGVEFAVRPAAGP